MAGLAAALPGAVAALTTKPVIGVPCGGRVPYDSLLSIAQLPRVSQRPPLALTVATTPATSPCRCWLSNPKYAAALEQNKLDQIDRVKAQDKEVNGGA